jgi:hypothetical protein
MGEHRCVAGLPRPDQHNHGPPMAVDEVMDLGGPATAGATDRVVRRLDPQIRVVRPQPPVARVMFAVFGPWQTIWT